MTQKRKILIVDDEPDVTLLVSCLLEFHNYTVTCLNDSTLVPETLKKTDFDLICTDIMMPNINGFSLIQQIRKDEKHKDAKLIALSAKEFTEDEYQFFLDQKVLLIKKPYEPQELVAKINGLLTQ